MPEPAHKRQLISTVYATPLMTPTMDLGLSIRLSMFELRETGDWDIFLGPPERARAETGGAEQWVLKQRQLPGFARVNKVTSAFLGHLLSVFNKNSTLKRSLFAERGIQKTLGCMARDMHKSIHTYICIHLYIYIRICICKYIYVGIQMNG